MPKHASMKNVFTCLLLFISSVSYSQLITDSVLIEQHYRSFSYNTPAGNIKNGNLMFVMHGSGGSSSDMIKRTTKLEALSVL
jgi:polyhydroxybutyrate depolymerase